MTVSSPDVRTTQTEALPDASDLEDKMPLWFRSSKLLVLFVSIGGILFLYFSYLSVDQTTVWGDLSYGELIWKTKSIPVTEPFMPLAEGMQVTDNAWLSQLGLYHLYMWYRVPALQFFHAACIAIVIGLLMGYSFFRSRNTTCTLAGLILFLWVSWQPLHSVQPQLVGLCCLMLLWGLLQSRKWKTGHYVSLFLLFVFWVNLHASFVIGLAIIAACCVGSFIDLLRRTDGFRSSFLGSRFRRYLSIFELAILATLLNPYGLRIYSGVASMVQSDNLQDLLQWNALTLRLPQGQAVAFLSLLLVIVYRMTPRRISTIEVIQLIGLGAAALWMAHMTIWWAMVAAWYFMLHASAVWNHSQSQHQEKEPAERKSLWTVMAMGIAFLLWAITPFGTSVLHGHQEKFDLKISRQTPRAAVEKLLDDRENGDLPVGQIFNTHEWGDYIVWKSGKEILPVFTASRVQAVPREVWQHYLQISNMGSDWFEMLDRYGVNVILIDKQEHQNFGKALKREEEWGAPVYEDNVSLLFYRKKPL
ncbi:hypothetical protein MNBD_PLANCTO02-1803 [hydrothermal vent metagenome]|uniref:Glycosyltransferase RgtA/B/C/D-like domain-containing protein n=1 Tax=hydrothermal vent metagenome TaxID=652676 RepID=A0A3B1DWZ8_9ZZZZ